MLPKPQRHYKLQPILASLDKITNYPGTVPAISRLTVNEQSDAGRTQKSTPTRRIILKYIRWLLRI